MEDNDSPRSSAYGVSRKRKREAHESNAASSSEGKSNPDSSGHTSVPKNSRLRKGMVIFKGFLSREEQQEIAVAKATLPESIPERNEYCTPRAAHVHRLGAHRSGGFYHCSNEKTKRMRMMNLGLRTDGGRHTLDIPREWTDIAVRACRQAAAIDPSIPILRPDVCVVNHYDSTSRLGWHQDLFSSRDPGLPVVSLSLGEAALFQYRVSWKKSAAVMSVVLESGDALIFGGRSRGIIHGVPAIGSRLVSAKPASDPAENQASASREVTGQDEVGRDLSFMPQGGRYNLNLREL